MPPRSAFNDHPVVQHSGHELFETHPDKLRERKGPQSQRGAGAYTLCGKCNNDTGTWYGDAFARFAYQGAHLIEHARAAPSLYHTFHIHPLRVLKQVYGMFLSGNPLSFNKLHPDLVRFVLNKESRYIDPRLRVFAYFNGGAVSRQSAITGRANFATGRTDIYSETTFPPFGFILVPNGGPPTDPALAEITHWSRHSYWDWTTAAIRLPVFDIYTAFPGDFRSRETVLAEAAAAPRDLNDET